MLLSFRGGLHIQLNNEFLLTGGYDYLEGQNHFVIEYAYFNRNLSIPQKMEHNIVYMKRERNGKWKIGNIVDGHFYRTEIKDLQAIEKYIVSEHCRGNHIGAGNKGRLHYFMKEFRKIA